MKSFAIAAAGLALLTGAAPVLVAPAAAQTVVHERTVVRSGPVRTGHSRQSCSWHYRGHHRVRVCRTVRYR